MERVYHHFSPKREELALMIIDVQDNLMKVMEPGIRQKIVNNIKLLIALVQKLGIPLILTEQYPKGLGKTLIEIRQVLESYHPVEKVFFSCYQDEGFKSSLKQLNLARAVLLTGVETHICLLQTALDLLANDYKVYVISDAVCSRRKLDWEIGLRLIERAGGIITTTEALIFQLLTRAATEEFRFMSKLLK